MPPGFMTAYRARHGAFMMTRQAPQNGFRCDRPWGCPAPTPRNEAEKPRRTVLRFCAAHDSIRRAFVRFPESFPDP